MIENLHSEPLKSSLWRAGAGAGKTYNLVERIYQIIDRHSKENHGELPRIVVTTFTRLATQELRIRFMQKMLSEGRRDLAPALMSSNRVLVTTLHGVMDRFLRGQCHELGLSPQFKLLTGFESDALLAQILAQTVDENASLKLLSCYGYERVKRMLTLLLAHPNRTDWQGTSLSELSAAYYEDLHKLSAELAKTNAEIYEAQNPKWTGFLNWAENLHNCIRIFLATSNEQVFTAMKALSNDLESIFAARPEISNTSKPKVMFRNDKLWKKDYSKAQELIADWSFWSEQIRNRDELLVELMQLAEMAQGQLQRQLKLKDGLRLEDLEPYSLDLLTRKPDAAEPFLRDWDYWLVDEYQDTSPIQVEILQKLSGSKPVFVVGDPQQSIYLFRGARPDVFLNRHSLALNESHQLVELSRNRRSNPRMIEFINQVSEELGVEFSSMSAHREDYVFASEKPAHWLELFESESLNSEQRRQIEASQLALWIEKCIAAGSAPSDIAILARKNSHLKVVAEALQKRGLPVELRSSGEFSLRFEVLDIMAVLRFSDNPHDDAALIAMARGPLIPIKMAVLTEALPYEISLWNRLKNAPELSLATRFLERVDRVGCSQALVELLMESQYIKRLQQTDPTGRSEANVIKFINMITEAERKVGFRLSQFIAEFEGATEGNINQDAVSSIASDAIHLMTIHGSKGLEFPIVVIPFICEGSKSRNTRAELLVSESGSRVSLMIPDQEMKWRVDRVAQTHLDKQKEWEAAEAKRLLYVAVTRARDLILMSSFGEPKENSMAASLQTTLSGNLVNRFNTIEAAPGFKKLFQQSSNSKNTSTDLPKLPPVHRKPTLLRISVTELLNQSLAAKVVKGAEKPVIEKEKLLMRSLTAARGSVIHRILELAKYATHFIEDGTPLFQVLETEIQRWFMPQEQEEVLQSIVWLLNLKEPKMTELLADPYGQTEWSFNVGLDPAELSGVLGHRFSEGVILEGQVDLFARDSTGAFWIVDYKTGDARYSDKAIQQLKVYALALRKLGVVAIDEEINFAAVFTFENKAVSGLC